MGGDENMSLEYLTEQRVFFRGAVCNVLLTCCKDSVCRLWAETLLPSDCLLSGHSRHTNMNSDVKKSSSNSGAHNPLEVRSCRPI